MLGSMPLTCRSCSSVHCDLLAKEEDPWNCFTLVRDTWAGLLFVTVEIKAQFLLMTSFAMQTNTKDVQPKFSPSTTAFLSSTARPYRLKLTSQARAWNALLSRDFCFPSQPHFPLSQQRRAGSRPLLSCSIFLLPK